ncbi:uncharacterized protein TNCV_5016351 [Trichonephila clavipes]|nr:uncharacterized protein TNCV_5016351 [Trichonephila clavipes]
MREVCVPHCDDEMVDLLEISDVMENNAPVKSGLVPKPDLTKNCENIIVQTPRILQIPPSRDAGVAGVESFRLTAFHVARDKPWCTLCKKSHGIPSSPRAAAVAKFRLLTGHDCLCAHLFRFNLVTSPICVLCDTGQDMTAAHLDECSALNDLNCIVKRDWPKLPDNLKSRWSSTLNLACEVTRFTHGAANAETDDIQRLPHRCRRVVTVSGDYINGL